MLQQTGRRRKYSDSPSPTKLSYEQFLAWASEDTRAEWVNGVVVVMSPVSDEHNQLGLFLLRVLSEYVEAQDAGVLRYESFQMKTGPTLPGRNPDILFVAKANLARLKSNHLEGPADLVVEIISPESEERDRKEKFAEYEQGGVREYWLLDPERKEAEFYQRDLEGKFQRVSSDDDGIYHSRVVSGLWINVGWLWQRPLPTLSAVRKAWGLA
jgi:Uma2 family endonuclease